VALMRPSPTADERPALTRNRTSQGFYRCSFMSSRPSWNGSVSAIPPSDSDKDGTVDKTEFQYLVEKLFQNTDKDHGGTLDKKEFGSSAGRIFLGLFVVRQGPSDLGPSPCG
jgi:hypothetical protein